MDNDKTYQRLIHTARWVRLRKWQLQRHPLCQLCQKEGRTTLATEVHHVTPVDFAISEDGKEQLMFNRGNLMSLCHSCHVMVHTRIGRSGRKRAREVEKSQLEEFRRKFMGVSD